VQFYFLQTSVNLSGAAFRRSEEPALSEVEGISRLSGLTREPNYTTTQMINSLAEMNAASPWRAVTGGAQKSSLRFRFFRDRSVLAYDHLRNFRSFLHELEGQIPFDRKEDILRLRMQHVLLVAIR